MKKKILLILLVCSMLLSSLTLSGIVAQPTEKIPVIIMFKDKQDINLIRQSGGEIKTVYHLKPALAASLPENAVENLKRNPNIEYVIEDKEVFLVEQTLPWGVDRIDADVVHTNGNNGSGINVAIMDTGIDYTHEDLNDNYYGGYDFAGLNWHAGKNDDNPMDYDGHGTHCAGIAAAENNTLGVIGVAPEAKLWAVKVFDDAGNGVYSDTIEGFEWCIDTHNDTDTENDIQVISMSFGSAGEYTPLNAWLDIAYGEGIVLVGAAGNAYEGDDTVIYPARYDNVIAVASTDIFNNRAISSSTGPAVELAAPGVSIYSTVPGGGYEAWSGTSMACPHVAGTAALVIATNISDGNANGRINDEVRTRLQVTADDLGDPGRDAWYGFGLVDANGAAPAAPLEVISCDLNGTPRDSFCPGEGVYVKAYGLEGDTDYTIWIQNESVDEDNELIPEEDPSASQESVTTDPDGSLPETLIWQIPSDAAVTHAEYDIILDKQNDGVNTGKYNSASDGIDSTTVAGILAPVPELSTIILFSIGLPVLAGYVVRGRRKNY